MKNPWSRVIGPEANRRVAANIARADDVPSDWVDEVEWSTDSSTLDDAEGVLWGMALDQKCCTSANEEIPTPCR